MSRAKRRTPERDIQKAILAHLKGVRGWWGGRANTGAMPSPDGQRWMRFGTPGAPDILGTYLGWSIGIEVKAKGNYQNANQKAWQAGHEAAGGIYLVARSVEDVKQKFAELRAELEDHP